MRMARRVLGSAGATVLLIAMLPSSASAGVNTDGGLGWTATSSGSGFYKRPPAEAPPEVPEGPQEPPPYPWTMTEVDNPWQCDDRPGCGALIGTTCLGEGPDYLDEEGRPRFDRATFRKVSADEPWTYVSDECFSVPDENWVAIEEFTPPLREELFKKIDKPKIEFKPSPKGLVNLPVILATEDPGPQSLDITVPLPGRITASPKYTWVFDDGTTLNGPGKAYDGTDPVRNPGYYPVSHRYGTTGEKKISLRVEWTGTVTVGDNEPQPIDPLVYNVDTTVTVREAKAVLGGN